MRVLLYASLVVILFGINLSLFSGWYPFDYLPNLNLLLCLIVSAQNLKSGWLVIVLSAVYWDIAQGLFPGTYLLGFVIINWLVYGVFKKINFAERPFRYLFILSILSVSILPFWNYYLNKVLIVLRFEAGVEVGLPGLQEVLLQFIFHFVMIFMLYSLIEKLENMLAKIKNQHLTY